ncbi:two-component system, chemotaxis family, response regulator CheB [Nitrosospira sp. Nl5]|uniref:chemotaxis-specific protein-glutamate methyltransferase CheB n=1 Tax=Nitrosospira sp. Nl5 TaxID=200120 RepID=UPI000881DEEE|nr:chemotaxis-specific protein-glutamate methyltransferase CheB [Nitrosospira sp. Nl5]SCY61709.1 two-component system, chemotaxis family, response regulator CheB [Nitrosospira sp. Nl5]
MINVLVVEDSPVVREFLVHFLSLDPDITVMATARDGEEALDFVRHRRPDVITMDIHMPKLNGLEATRRIMETNPTPIVIVSGSEDPHEIFTTFDAMDAGALAVLRRPAGVGHPDHEATIRDMLETIKLMSEVKVVRRWPRLRSATPILRPAIREPVSKSVQIRIVIIGASTGGPSAIEAILAALPKNFPVPILIVQHISPGFIGGFVQWLANSSDLPVHVATHGELLLPGHVYVAPDDYQMKVERKGKIALTKDEPEHGLRPSISYLFRAVAEVYGCETVAGLLTGMGRDGAAELLLLREKGAITFAQDKDSSIVHGMPGEAIKLDAAMLVLPLEKIAAALTDLVNADEKKRA